jgi:hypothetical protein
LLGLLGDAVAAVTLIETFARSCLYAIQISLETLS